MANMKVRYKGLSDVRRITKKDLEPHGVVIDRDLEFSRSNNFAMNIDLNDALTAILKNEGTFSITEIKDDGTAGDEVVKATMADDSAVAATAKDADTGQSSENPNAGQTPAGGKAPKA